MIKNPLVSVLIPIYNCKDTIDRCVKSILSQDYRNFELLLVNDGSIDESYKICQQYVSDNRVKLFDKPNGGPASARNFGLERCSPSAVKVCFVDSDDYIDSDFISSMIAIDSDMVIGGMTHHAVDGSIRLQSFGNHDFSSFWENKDFIVSLQSGALHPPCGKLYDLGIIRRHGLRFPDVRVLEDVSFNFDYLEHCRSVSMIDYVGYHYVHRPGSETSRADMETVDNYCRFHSRLHERFSSRLAVDVDRFIYPHYMALILRFIRRGDHRSARAVMGRQLVRKSFSAHRSGSVGEAVVKKLIRMRATLLAKWLI